MALCRDLARQRPEVYRPDVAGILSNLGFVRHDLKDPTSAKETFEEALTSYRDLAQKRPEVYRREVAMTLNKLGTMQFDLDDAMSARSSCEEALAICRDLDREHPGSIDSSSPRLSQPGQRPVGRLERPGGGTCRIMKRQRSSTSRRPRGSRRRGWWNAKRHGPISGGWCSRSGPSWDGPIGRRRGRRFRKAVACAELFREQFRDERQRRRVQAENLEVYERLIEVCVDLWEIEREPPRWPRRSRPRRRAGPGG